MGLATSLLVTVFAAQALPGELVVDAEWPSPDTLRLELAARLIDLADVVDAPSGDRPRYTLRLSPGSGTPTSPSAHTLAVLLTDADGHELLRGEAEVPRDELPAARYLAVLVEGALRMFALTGAPPRFEPVRPQRAVATLAPALEPTLDLRLYVAFGSALTPTSEPLTLRLAAGVQVWTREWLGLGLRLTGDLLEARTQGLGTREGFAGVEAIVGRPLGPLGGVAALGLGAVGVRAAIDEPLRARTTSFHAAADLRAGLDWPVAQVLALTLGLELLALAEPPEHLIGGEVVRQASPLRLGLSVGVEVRP